MVSGTPMTYVAGGDHTGLPTAARRSRGPRPTPKPLGLDWDALTPACVLCGTRSGELDAADTCPTCRGVVTPAPVAAPKPAAPRPRRSKATGAPRRVVGARLTDDLVAQVASEYQDGDTIATLSARHKLSKGYVLQALAKAGVPTRPRGVNVRGYGPLAGKAQDIVDGYLAGASAPELAARFGVTPTSIYAVLNRQNVPRRTLGRTTKETA